MVDPLLVGLRDANDFTAVTKGHSQERSLANDCKELLGQLRAGDYCGGGSHRLAVL
jgi:hypothetical protein